MEGVQSFNSSRTVDSPFLLSSLSGVDGLSIGLPLYSTFLCISRERCLLGIDPVIASHCIEQEQNI